MLFTIKDHLLVIFLFLSRRMITRYYDILQGGIELLSAKWAVTFYPPLEKKNHPPPPLGPLLELYRGNLVVFISKRWQARCGRGEMCSHVWTFIYIFIKDYYFYWFSVAAVNIIFLMYSWKSKLKSWRVPALSYALHFPGGGRLPFPPPLESTLCKTQVLNCMNFGKEMSLCHKLKFSSPYIFATWCCKPVIFIT